MLRIEFRFQFTPLLDNEDEEGLMDEDNQENEVFGEKFNLVRPSK